MAKTIRGRCQSNSGAGIFGKGDVANKNWLIECKTCTKEKESFAIKKQWLETLKKEAFGMNKEFFALVFNFGELNGENYYILNEKIFKQILDILEETN